MSSTCCLTSETCRYFGSAWADSVLRCYASHLCFCCRLLSCLAEALSSAASAQWCYCAKAYSVALRCCATCCCFASYVSCYDCHWARNRYSAASVAAAVGGYCCTAAFASAEVSPADACRAIRAGCVRRRSAYTPCGARGCDSTGCERSVLPCRTYTNLLGNRERMAVVVPKPNGCHSGSRTERCSHRPATEETKSNISAWHSGEISFLSLYEATLKKYGFPVEAR